MRHTVHGYAAGGGAAAAASSSRGCNRTVRQLLLASLLLCPLCLLLPAPGWPLNGRSGGAAAAAAGAASSVGGSNSSRGSGSGRGGGGSSAAAYVTARGASQASAEGRVAEDDRADADAPGHPRGDGLTAAVLAGSVLDDADGLPFDHEQLARRRCDEPGVAEAMQGLQWLPAPESFLTMSSAVRQEATREEWSRFLQQLRPYNASLPGGGSGRGIVYFGGAAQLEPLRASIGALRALGCALPVEVWHFEGELSMEQASQLSALGNVTPRDLSAESSYRRMAPPAPGTKPYYAKPAAVLGSGFEEMLYLDADVIPVADPTGLFDSPHYMATGAVFWADLWKTHSLNPIYRLLRVPCYDEREFDSGAMVLDKRRAWKVLQLAWHMGYQRPEVYYALLYYDKDTYRFASKETGSPYHLVRHPAAIAGFVTNREQRFCGTAMVHRFPGGAEGKGEGQAAGSAPGPPPPLFVHATLLKYGGGLGGGMNGFDPSRPWTHVQEVPGDWNHDATRPAWWMTSAKQGDQPHQYCLELYRTTGGGGNSGTAGGGGGGTAGSGDGGGTAGSGGGNAGSGGGSGGSGRSAGGGMAAVREAAYRAAAEAASDQRQQQQQQRRHGGDDNNMGDDAGDDAGDEAEQLERVWQHAEGVAAQAGGGDAGEQRQLLPLVPFVSFLPLGASVPVLPHSWGGTSS